MILTYILAFDISRILQVICHMFAVEWGGRLLNTFVGGEPLNLGLQNLT